MKTTALEKKYDALNKAHQAETTPAVEQKESDDKTSSEKETDGKTSGEQGPDQKVGADKSTEQDTVDKVMSTRPMTAHTRTTLITLSPVRRRETAPPPSVNTRSGERVFNATDRRQRSHFSITLRHRLCCRSWSTRWGQRGLSMEHLMRGLE